MNRSSIRAQCWLAILPGALALLTSFALAAARAGEKPGIDWQPWSDKVFAQAAAEHKFVLLDLGAGWCHWCHVMDQLTYSDPEVIKLLREKYIAVRVDQDARPDLANRYEDYGWPATIVFNADRGEIVKRQGYIPPKPMASLLQAIIDDPTPGPSVAPEPAIVPAADSALTKEQRAAMRASFTSAYDAKVGGWGDVHKYLNWDALEYCIVEGAAGDAAMEKMARQTLNNGLKLIDPVWGGVDQYSTDGDWDHPHYEKIMPFQAETMRVLALASRQWNEPNWLEQAQKVHGYLKSFLTSPEGAFYTSQDADLVEGEHGGSWEFRVWIRTSTPGRMASPLAASPRSTPRAGMRRVSRRPVAPPRGCRSIALSRTADSGTTNAIPRGLILRTPSPWRALSSRSIP